MDEDKKKAKKFFVNQNFKHLPSYYIAGIYAPKRNAWVGDFIASVEELYDFGSRPGLDEARFQAVNRMIETQQIYEEWWYDTLETVKIMDEMKKNQEENDD